MPERHLTGDTERGESFVRSSGEVFKPTNLTPYSEIRLIRTSNKGKNRVLEKEVIFVTVTKVW